MSDNLPKQQSSEEIDLGQLFNAIEKLFNKLFSFIKEILYSIFSGIILSIKAFLDNWKLISICLISAFVVGKTLEASQPTIYASQMLVRPHFNSKYQLVNNIDYYNALLSAENYTSMSNIFEMDESEVKEIVSFEIKNGPETENDRVIQFDRYLRSIDSIRRIDLDYEDFIENRSIYDGDIFEVFVESRKKDIFSKLEHGIKSSFANEYSIKEMKDRDSIIEIKRKNIQRALGEVKKLQEMYIEIVKEESKSNDKEISLGKNFSLSASAEKTKTKEYQLLLQEIELRDEMRKLDDEIIQDNVFFDILSNFQEVGNPVSKWENKYSLIFPVLILLFLTFLYLSIRLIKYVINYEK